MNMEKSNMEAKHIAVIGDIMMDEYIYGDVDRVSPESCCPVLHERKRSFQLGGAANVAFQLKRLGAEVSLVGIVGDDKMGKQILAMLKKERIDCSIVFAHKVRTTCKSRYINHLNQQMFRSDVEEPSVLDNSEIDIVLQYIGQKKISAVIISDYNKGVASKELCREVITLGRKKNKLVLVDIKEQDIDKYRGATIVKGNKKEVMGLWTTCHEQIDKEKALAKLRKELDTSLLVMTCGGEGISAIDDNDKYYRYPAEEHHVFDVTGAGDTVTAYCSFLLSNGFDLDQSLYYSNKAASIKVGRFGNSCVYFDEVVGGQTKLVTMKQLQDRIKGKRVVFTNGCFDVIHAGHVDLLQKAKELGEVLVVALNGDESIRKIKGCDRPFNSLDERIKVLSSISYVDYIITFDTITPLSLIKEICPAVLVKGGDYTIDSIVGADFVRNNGGDVQVIPFVYETSTTKLLKHFQ
jgi:D-beta-D-heptose 7-phosphate kinase/D-beta-D-heptose 1-phosphate adenosyltransferase